MAQRFTKRQGEYLAFIHLYMTLNKRAPAEADIQAHFGVSAAAVHQMIVSLESRGLIRRTPGQTRSIRLVIPPELLPGVGAGPRIASEEKPFVVCYPNTALWIMEHGTIELGYDYNTGTYARAIEEGGMAWSGGSGHETIDEWLEALEIGIGACLTKLGW